MNTQTTVAARGPHGLVFHSMQWPTRWAFAPLPDGETKWYKSKALAMTAFNRAGARRDKANSKAAGRALERMKHR